MAKPIVSIKTSKVSGTSQDRSTTVRLKTSMTCKVTRLDSRTKGHRQWCCSIYPVLPLWQFLLAVCSNYVSTQHCKLVAWHSGRTSVSGWRTFPVLRSTCSWWVTTNVGKPSATGQPTRPTQPFILSGSIKWVVSWNQMCAAVYR